MTMRVAVFVITIVIALGTFWSCSTTEQPVQEEPVEEKTPPPQPKEQKPEEPEKPEEPQEKEEPVTAEEPKSERETVEGENYEVTEEVYKRAFDDIEDLIAKLNSIIEKRDYETWLEYITDGYEDKYSDPDVLEEKSSQPTLQKYDIELDSLRDYFLYVVVPSRAEARLDDIIFLDDNHVKAVMKINDHEVILYLLEKVNDTWKICTREEAYN